MATLLYPLSPAALSENLKSRVGVCSSTSSRFPWLLVQTPADSHVLGAVIDVLFSSYLASISIHYFIRFIQFRSVSLINGLEKCG